MGVCIRRSDDLNRQTVDFAYICLAIIIIPSESAIRISLWLINNINYCILSAKRVHICKMKNNTFVWSFPSRIKLRSNHVDLGPPHKGDIFAANCKNIAFDCKMGWSEIGNLSISLWANKFSSTQRQRHKNHSEIKGNLSDVARELDYCRPSIARRLNVRNLIIEQLGVMTATIISSLFSYPFCIFQIASDPLYT